jgi:hypothetical protein
MGLKISKIVTSIGVLILWPSLGIWVQRTVPLWQDYPAGESAFSWPHSVLTYVHWIWTSLLGVSFVCAVVLSSRLPPGHQRIINIVLWLLTISAWLACWWGAIPHRMIYPVSL